ncbi:hypothetical protein ABZT47_38825 [Sphaerisporangium sp. NPDC005289]|uniref:hypothetical protein n=1 Tax=Sphaerisporangium sp. NPDC005289 TaxID=3155247 RepID=UPI0033A807AF
MDGFFVDHGGLRDLVRGHSARQLDVDAFPGVLSELTGALSEVAERLGRDRPAPGRPPTVTI